MKTLTAIIGILFLSLGIISAQTPVGEDILKQIDKNMVVDKAVSQTTMIIHGRAGTRSVKAKTWTQGRDKAFVEYTDPPREKGKKMLKLGDQIWNYIPEPTDRIITISGHLLRQSVMGSDLSYEDITENRKLTDIYNAKLKGSEKLQGRDCYVVELTAKQEDVTYYSRKLWVDKEKWLPLKEERYARSGKPLKMSEITEVMRVDNRWYPKKMTFRDLMQTGSEGTEYIIDSIDFHASIPESRFTKAALKK
ncbi:MAG: outer membrane lipoprotein-sorting protein [Bacteroidota bacterium]|jgi:outer membrane lipoprotein-sorting protein|nr:outer membrane lipoprotein-sorting protein [Ignavibacteria bacterium]MCU7513424.1 outer membrane lipoprotein-sorting protein [Ignavibacteria bacterium]MCU7525128.1 outer membrane lipoprotein-sorting protein [Ignavibacteria bacterium]